MSDRALRKRTQASSRYVHLDFGFLTVSRGFGPMHTAFGSCRWNGLAEFMFGILHVLPVGSSRQTGIHPAEENRKARGGPGCGVNSHEVPLLTLGLSKDSKEFR